MSLDFPALNSGHIPTQTPDIASQQDSKSEKRNRVDNEEDKQEDYLCWSWTKVLNNA